MKTEAEARKCWCPFVRASAKHGAVAINRQTDAEGRLDTPVDTTADRCIASECMAWRWGERWNKPDVNGKMVEQPREGCCGLAGKC